MLHHQPARIKRLPSTRAFSLIELLAVMAIFAIMLTLLTPALKGFGSTAGRKGAVNILMNTFEQARSAALETGTNVYVVLRKRQFPEQDSVMVLRDPAPWSKIETGLQPLTKWINLPKGILLYDPPKIGKNLFKDSSLKTYIASNFPSTGAGGAPDASDIAVMKFSASGTIQSPANKDFCRLLVGEGFRGADKVETLINPNKDAGLFDVITFRRFTGRASLDVSSLSSIN